MKARPKYLISIGIIIAINFGVAASLWSCRPTHAPISIDYYAKEKPTLELDRFFNGTLEGHGVQIAPDGTIQRRFKLQTQASWKDGVGTLDETYLYSDGQRQNIVWTLHKINEHEYSGGSLGLGKGVAHLAGNSLHGNYALEVAGFKFDVDEWTHLIDENSAYIDSRASHNGNPYFQMTVIYQKVQKP